jgi:anti-anti-sigma factor
LPPLPAIGDGPETGRASRPSASGGGWLDHQLRVNLERFGDLLLLTVAGEFDAASVTPFRRRWRSIVAEAGDTLVIDLQQLKFADGAACRAILECQQRLRGRGLHVEALRGPPAVMRAFALTGLADYIDFIDRSAQRSP